MRDFSTSYGHRRPLAIAAKIADLQARFAPVGPPVVFMASELQSVTTPEEESFGVSSQKIQAWQIERADLRLRRAELRGYRLNPEICAELETIEERLADLDDFLIFEPDCDFDAQEFDFQLFDDYDEFDPDLPDELDGSYAANFAPAREVCHVQ